MPPNRLTPLFSAAAPDDTFPFQLSAVTVYETDQTAGRQENQDCQCPCGLSTNMNIAASSMFIDVPTGSAAPGTGQAMQGVIVEVESYLYRSILPSARQYFDDSDISNYGTYNADPVLRIYGLGIPIVTQDFLSDEAPGSLATVKIWLTVCFPSGETDSEWDDLFQPCTQNIKNDIAANVASANWRSLRPQVAFISFGKDYPKPLVTVRTIDKSIGTTNPPSPRIERRQVEAHVPIGEVDMNGKVVQQYIESNLFLDNICFNGTPALYPRPVFSNYG